MALATLSIDLVAQLASLQSGMDKAGRIAEKQAAMIEARYKSMSAAASSIGAALGASLSVGLIVQFVRATVDGVDKLNDLADATGASIENLSALEDIAKRTGTSMNTAGAAVIKLNKALSDAKPGSDQAEAISAIGLSVEKLKTLDPAEALRQVAIAMSGYANDGNKARLAQELFGKSLAEVAPLLKDLAEKGEFNAKVTTEQAQRAEDFNKQLFELKKNTEDAARSLVEKLIPALIELVKGFNTGGLRGVGDAIGEMIGLGKEYHATRDLKILADDLKLLELQTATAPKGPGRTALQKELEAKTKEYEAARDTYIKVRGLDKTTPAFRPSQNYGDTRVSLPSIGGKAATPDGGAAKRLAEYLATMKAQLEGEEQAVKDVTEAWQAWEKIQISIADRGLSFTSKMFTESEKKAAEQVAVMKEADDLVARGAISWATYGRAATSALKESTEEMNKAFADMPKFVDAPLKQISVFAQEAARNIQDTLGDSLEKALTGNFGDIGRLWVDMLKKMAAQAAAAQLNQYLFGDTFNAKGGSNTGAIGSLFSLFGSFGGARATGGPVSSGRPYLVGERGPELMVPNGSGTVVPNSALGGTQITYAPVFQFSDASAEQMGRIRAVARAEYARFARQMSVQGAI